MVKIFRTANGLTKRENGKTAGFCGWVQNEGVVESYQRERRNLID